MSIPMRFWLNWHVNHSILHASCIQVVLKKLMSLRSNFEFFQGELESLEVTS
jgi:hypothetical protein